ncbi:hypothetical protein [Chenggangzhangella methanolivorans]|uniref:Uncharacterized protein n=1 Tax=Chenggangzhangella methanolivorans TaxID=1437009 RepID=A0A9E6RAX7_9HYPH|nr:hypothetical protein [Chenggangzhangella methanolivorans]QZO01409.1 hypothetical protein K6K41_08130 [Chenggangzhangella methanolivorans]
MTGLLSKLLPSRADAAPKPFVRDYGVWVLGGSAEAFEAAAPLIEAALVAQPRLKIYVTGPKAAAEALTRRFPRYVVRDAPPAFGLLVRRFLAATRMRCVIALDDVDVPAATLSGVLGYGLALVSLRTSPGAAAAKPDIAGEALLKLDLSRGSMDEAVAELGKAIARDHKLLRATDRRRFTPSALALAAATGAKSRALVDWRLKRLVTPQELFAELGRPETVFCLGTGPSSEDPILRTMAYDVLFRVNRKWAGRSHFTKPDMVFTARQSVMVATEGAVFGVRSHASEVRLMRTRAFDPRRGRSAFARADLIAPALVDYDWGAFRPTNGAAMLAVSVALAPKRLIVAGIDMYSHPDGAYPGDAATPNAFAPAHDAETEREFLLQRLESYAGELVIVGDTLRAAFEARGGRLGRLPSGDDAA